MKKILFLLLNLIIFLTFTSCKDEENYCDISDDALLEKINLPHTQKYDLCTISYEDNNEKHTANYSRISDNWDYSSWKCDDESSTIIASLFLISCGAYYHYTNPVSQITIGEVSYAWYVDGEKLKYSVTTKYGDSLIDRINYYYAEDGYLTSLSEEKSSGSKTQTIKAKIKYSINE